MSDVSPVEVLRRVADAIPESVRGNVIVVGSLAAGYSFFADDAERTVRTKDGKLSAQFEHTIAVTEDGAEVLTAFSGPLRGSEPREVIK